MLIAEKGEERALAYSECQVPTGKCRSAGVGKLSSCSHHGKDWIKQE